MKLLLDENLFRRSVSFLMEAFPESTQVVLLGLENADDKVIWQYAKNNGFVLVIKDADFLIAFKRDAGRWLRFHK